MRQVLQYLLNKGYTSRETVLQLDRDEIDLLNTSCFFISLVQTKILLGESQDKEQVVNKVEDEY